VNTLHPPNILLITTDQQRYDTAPPAAPDFLRLPHLDHLAREGVTMRSAYAQTPVCVPARLSLMTGRSPFSHGLTANGATSERIGRADTLPTVLRSAGYATAAIGKMHFTPQRARHGFDEMILPDDYYRWITELGPAVATPMRTGLGQNELYPGVATVPEALTLTSWIAEQAVRYIRDRRDPTMPFFVWVSFTKPHPPLDPPEPYASMYRDSPIPEPVHGEWSTGSGDCPVAFERQRQRHGFDLIPPPIIRAAREAYLGLITHVDYAIGRIFAALQDIGAFDDTLILFTSDHGEFLGDHGCGNKVMFHEPSAHVPFILRPPKSWAAPWTAATSDMLVTHADVLPTLVAAAGTSASAACTGLNLFDVLDGHTPARAHLCATATERPDDETPIYLAVTDGRWKYIWYPEGGQQQLFDLATDPTELHDLHAEAATEPTLARLHDTLVESLASQGSPWSRHGRLVEVPIRHDTEAERRRHGWPGYHTETYNADVRH
jgi:arylsulfatase